MARARAVRVQLVKVGTLLPDQRFRFPDSGRSGRVIYQSPMGTTVRFDGLKHRVVQERDTNTTLAEFDAPNRPLVIAAGAEVEVLHAD